MAQMDKNKRERILQYLAGAVETVEKDTDEIIGVYIEFENDGVYS